MTSGWVRREARYRIVDIVSTALAGADELADAHGYSDAEFDAIQAEMRSIMARHEQYAARIPGERTRHG